MTVTQVSNVLPLFCDIIYERLLNGGDKFVLMARFVATSVISTESDQKRYLQDGNTKFDKTNKKSIDIDTSGMFDDSNDSFEIPETQANPASDDFNKNESDDDFVAIPDEEISTNNSSQSQDLLCGVSLFDSQVTRTVDVNDAQLPKSYIKETNNDDAFKGFDDNDDIDLELSKLEWDESTKDDDKSASVTPDLDFHLLSTKPGVTDPITDLKSKDADVSSTSDGKEVSS